MFLLIFVNNISSKTINYKYRQTLKFYIFHDCLKRFLHFSQLALSEQGDHAYFSLQELLPEITPENLGYFCYILNNNPNVVHKEESRTARSVVR